MDAAEDVLREGPEEGGGGGVGDGTRESGELNLLVGGVAPRVAKSDDRGLQQETHPVEKLGLVRG